MKVFIPILSSIKIEIKDQFIYIYGPLGLNKLELLTSIRIEIFNNHIILSEINRNKLTKSNFGLFLALLKNSIAGVARYFLKTLKISGSGYKFLISNKFLYLFVGKTKKTFFAIPDELNVTLLDSSRISISGIDKYSVGEFSAKIRSISPVEPYKLRGISYLEEITLKKEGKKKK